MGVLASAIGWPDVAIALIAGTPGIIAAFYGRHNAKQLVTGNGKTVGEIVTEANGKLSREDVEHGQHDPTGAP